MKEKNSNAKNIFKRLTAIVLCVCMVFGLVACAGPAGPEGPQGIQGEKGDKGDKGDPGNNAVANTGAVYTPSDDISESLISPPGTNASILNANGMFYPDYTSKEETLKAGEALNIEIASEGFVLLKNKDNALPLKAYEKNITLFGYRSVELQTVGGGSGAGDGSGYEYSLLESMEAAGFNVNTALLSYYKANRTTQSITTGLGGETAPVELNPADYTSQMSGSFKTFGDAVLWTISRTGSEGGDLVRSNLSTHEDQSEHYLELDDNEKAVFEFLKEQKNAGVFNKVIVIVNSANPMELGEINDADEVDGIIWIGHPGNSGIMALGKILTGEVNPSGHLSDIYPRDFKQDPSWFNFGDNSQILDENGEPMDTRVRFVDEEGELQNTAFYSIEYREGIYTGYRWYETYADDLNAKNAGDGDKWYNEQVVYPFGYGLSYTTFEWKIDNVKSNATINAANETITMRVWVKNTGNTAGKDVIQVYYTAPYTNGGIEKASANLVGFAKTDLLQPGEAQVVEVQFIAQDMASYDYSDKNNNGFKGYELEAGDYIISIRKNSHEVVDSVVRTVSETILCTTDSTTGNVISNVFTGENGLDRYKSTNDALEANQISRTDGLTLPTTSTVADRTISIERNEMLAGERTYSADRDQATDIWYVTQIPSDWTQSDGTDRNENGMCDILLSDMAGIPYSNSVLVDGTVIVPDDPDTQKWEDFMNQLTYDEMKAIAGYGFFATAACPAIGKTQSTDSDGPAQLKAGFLNQDLPGGTLWAANVVIGSTWNEDLAYRVGTIVGNESLFMGVSGWYGPAMNIHRSPFSGRNFEYYSQDALHSGALAVATIHGAASKGVKTYIKHMFLNDQETNRTNNGIQWADEQTIREIYSKPFAMAIKEGGTTAIMASGGRVGDNPVYTNYAALEVLLRGEWDYKGFVMTDWYTATYAHHTALIRNGCDLPLGNMWGPVEHEGTWVDGKCMITVGDEQVESLTQYYAVRKAAQRVLYASVNSNANNNGTHAFDFADMDVTLGFATVIPGNDWNPMPTVTPATVSVATEGVDALCVVYSASGLPEGVTMGADGVLSSTLTEAAEFDVEVSVTFDWYVTYTYTVHVTVAEAA